MEAVPNPKAATIAEVARQAGVGIGTVSRVLNDAPSVADETRRRVKQVIKDLDYQPSQVARNLSTGRTSTIAAVVPFVTHPSSIERLRGLVRVLTPRRYDMALYDVELREQRDEQLKRLSAPGRADAVVIVSLPLGNAEIRRFQSSGIPLILLDAHHPELNSIVTDNVLGGALATRHLIELGHRRIGFVGDAPVNPYGFTSSADRRSGYRAALTEAGIAFDPSLVKEGVHDGDVAAGLTEQLLVGHPDPPTAIFAASDTQALGVLDAARRLGRRVPDDLSVIGFDDIEVARHVGLTTVRQPLEESGSLAAEMLLGSLSRDGAGPSTTYLDLSLTVRSTTSQPSS
jgi:DNA-binding LacI/PurR family transcriptional regulator